MANSNSRGQSVIELFLIMLVLTVFVFVALGFAEISRGLFNGIHMSRQTR